MRSILALVFFAVFSFKAFASSSQEFVVNGRSLTADEAHQFSEDNGLILPPGKFWYDPYSGAWGREGGPALGFTLPWIDFEVGLSPDASGGGDGSLSGVFINGREVPASEYDELLRVLGYLLPGHYWLDSLGYYGLVFGEPLGNLFFSAEWAGSEDSYLKASSGGYPGSDGKSYFFDPASK